MTRHDYIAAFIADSLMGNAGRELPVRCPKGALRERIGEALETAERTWPDFERELARLGMSAAAGVAHEAECVVITGEVAS